jgi:hypothetical protein
MYRPFRAPDGRPARSGGAHKPNKSDNPKAQSSQDPTAGQTRRRVNEHASADARTRRPVTHAPQPPACHCQPALSGRRTAGPPGRWGTQAKQVGQPQSPVRPRPHRRPNPSPRERTRVRTPPPTAHSPQPIASTNRGPPLRVRQALVQFGAYAGARGARLCLETAISGPLLTYPTADPMSGGLAGGLPEHQIREGIVSLWPGRGI